MQSDLANSHLFLTNLGEKQNVESAINLDRVDYTSNHIENPDFEIWNDPYDPDYLSTSTSMSSYGWLASSPWPVANGTHSAGMQIRSYTGDFAYHRIGEGSYTHWVNPVNLTMSFYYYIETITNPVDSDYFMLEFRLGNPGTKYLRYYFGSSITATNSTSYRYFWIDTNYGEWYHFDRNITADYIDGFSVVPTEYEGFDFYLRSYSVGFSRVFVDTIEVYNNSLYKSDTYDSFGDFRAYLTSNNDPGIVSQSTTRVSGDYSMNMSCYSLDNRSYAEFSTSPEIRLTENNRDSFTFYWQIDQWTAYSKDTLAYVLVNCKNHTEDGTEEFSIYYPLAYGDTFKHNYSGYHIIFPEAFNTTGTWNLFNRSIYDDITARNDTSEVIVQSVEFKIESDEYQANITLLVDDMDLHASALSAMGFEDEGAVGTNAHGLLVDSGYQNEINVTDFALTGEKAANLTIEGSNYFYSEQELAYMPITEDSELYLTFSWYIDDFTNLTDEYVEISIYFEDEDALVYVLANGSSRDEGEGSSGYYDLPSETGVWHTAVRNIGVDYFDYFGVALNDAFYGIELSADCDDRIEVIFDDFYLYEDPAPTITNLQRNPSLPNYDQEVTISCDVVDSSLDTVLLHYQVDGPAFTNVTMTDLGNGTFIATIPSQDYGQSILYYVSANDTYGKLSELKDGTNYFTYTVSDSILPTVTISQPENQSTVSGTETISVTASDEGSGIERVLIYVDTTLVANLTDGPFTYDWNTTDYENGEHDIHVEVLDNAGNENWVLHVVTVSNEVTTTDTTTDTTTTETELPPTDFTMIYILAAVIAGIVIVVIVIMFRNKQK